MREFKSTGGASYSAATILRPAGLTVCAISLAFTACRGDKKDPRTQAVVPPVVATSGKPIDTVGGSRSRVTWNVANLEKALRSVGLDPVRKGVVRQPFLGAEGVAFTIGSAELQAYIYADAVAVGRDTDPLDTVAVAPPGMKVNWIMPPTLIVKNNLALILLTRDASLRQRVRRALSR